MRVMTVVLAACAASALTTGPAWAARGGDGELKILFWQAVSTLNPYLSGGIKEGFASSIVLEPLASFNEKGELTSRLAESLPTLENLARHSPPMTSCSPGPTAKRRAGVARRLRSSRG